MSGDSTTESRAGSDSARPRVLGVTMINDAWPLAGVAIAHALEAVVDDVLVIDHASADDGPAGFAALAGAYPGRVLRRRIESSRYRQEAAVGAALRSLDLSGYDWIYPFDVDEFALLDREAFTAFLDAIDPEVGAVRYAVDNFVADEQSRGSLGDLLRVRARSVPALSTAGPAEEAGQRLEAGELSLFDVPFDSKLVHRASDVYWAAAGAHVLREPEAASEVVVDRAIFRVAHVPVLSRSALTSRAEHGRKLREAGYPPGHGWQNQAIERVVAAGGIDDLWRRHSVAGDASADGSGRPVVVDDAELAETLEPVVAAIEALVLPTAPDPAEVLSARLIEALAVGWAGYSDASVLRLELDDVAAQRKRLHELYEQEQRQATQAIGALSEQVAASEHQAAELAAALLAREDDVRRAATRQDTLRTQVGALSAELIGERDRRRAADIHAAWRERQVREINASITWRAVQRAKNKVRGDGAHPSLATRLGSLALRGSLRVRAHLQSGPPVVGSTPAESIVPIELTVPEFAEPDVSIVLPVHADADMTMTCLRSIVAASAEGPTYEVIVADDAAPEDVQAMLATVQGIRVVRNEVNQGFLLTVNRAAAEARAPITLLLNNDTEPQIGWLEPLVDRLDRDQRVGAVGGRLVYPDGVLQEAGGVVYADGSAINYGNGTDPSAAKVRFARPVDYCSAALLAIRTSLWQELGGFDELFVPGYYEDTDLCFRIRQAGYDVWYEPRSRVIHKEGGSHGTDTTQGVKRYQVVNQRHFADRWRDQLADRPATATADGAWRWANRTDGPVVFVADHLVPEPDRDSGSLRMSQLLSAFVDLGARVIFHPFNGWPTPGYTEQLESLGIEVLDGGVPLLARLTELAPVCDLAILSRPAVASQLLPDIRTYLTNATVLYDTVDLHWVREEARMAFEAVPVGTVSALREIELALVRASDVVAVVTEEERVLIEGLEPGVDVRCLPNVHELPSGVPGRELRRGVLFVGGFRHLPNVDAARQLGEFIMPAVRAAGVEVSLTIVGADAPADVRALEASDIRVTGWIPEVVPVLDSSIALVAPLRYGAGMKGKVGQALAHGLPVITTAIGAQGFGLVDGHDVLLAETPEEFAAAIKRLQADDALWAHLSTNGRDVIARTCSTSVISNAVAELLELAASRRLSAGIPASRS